MDYYYNIRMLMIKLTTYYLNYKSYPKLPVVEKWTFERDIKNEEWLTTSYFSYA